MPTQHLVTGCIECRFPGPYQLKYSRFIVPSELAQEFDALTNPEIKQTLANLNSAVDDLRGLVVRIDDQVQPTSDQLAQTLKDAQKALTAFNDAAASAQHFIAAQNGIGEEATLTMQQLREAAAALERLADFLERNPTALLSGRKPPQ